MTNITYIAEKFIVEPSIRYTLFENYFIKIKKERK